MLIHKGPFQPQIFYDVQTERAVFQFVPITSGPATGRHYEEPGSVKTSKLNSTP